MSSARLSALASAWRRRTALAQSADTNTYRLVNRAGDGFPDLSVDRYADVLVANIYGEGAKVQPPIDVLQALAEHTSARAVYVKYRPVQANVLAEDTRDELAPSQPLVGEAVERIEVIEHGLRFEIRPGRGLSTGLFLDMRDARTKVRANAAGKTVLNCFAYTCGFGVAALKGGATRVLNLDISRASLDWGERNTALNGFTPARTDFVDGDVFDWLRRFGKRGQTFDVAVLDPPSYSTTRETRFSVERDTPSLVALAAKVVRAGGRLIVCTNHHQLPLSAFKTKVREGLSGARAKIVRVEHEPAIDFPVAPGAQPYLKVCIVQFD
jgi:23S rRNA (cytosine1962-C5)-methyltransferase